MATLRVRLVFEDDHMLSKSQKSQGMTRSWLLLRPQHQTISDLASYLFHMFDLYHSCPHGLQLSMDGFVLPPFESTSLLKDDDIICLKKKGSALSDIFKISNAVNLIEEVKVVNGQLLTNGEFERECGSFLSELAEEADKKDTLPGVPKNVHNLNNRHQEDGKGVEDVTNKPKDMKKGPSRNARRKKAKRIWLREMAKIKKKRPHVSELESSTH